MTPNRSSLQISLRWSPLYFLNENLWVHDLLLLVIVSTESYRGAKSKVRHVEGFLESLATNDTPNSFSLICLAAIGLNSKLHIIYVTRLLLPKSYCWALVSWGAKRPVHWRCIPLCTPNRVQFMVKIKLTHHLLGVPRWKFPDNQTPKTIHHWSLKPGYLKLTNSNTTLVYRVQVVVQSCFDSRQPHCMRFPLFPCFVSLLAS